MSTLSIHTKALAFSDLADSNNPIRRHFDWTRNSKRTVSNARAQQESIEAAGTKTVFDGTRSTSLDNTTAFTSAQSSLSSDRYRFTWSGGTDPVLRTARTLTLNTKILTVVVNSNQTATFSINSGTFGAIAAGDTLYLPSVATGDSSSPIDVSNTGFWTVIAVQSSTSIQVERRNGDDFLAVAGSYTLSADSQFQAFASTGVQVGDTVVIGAGFAANSQRTYVVAEVTATWFEVVSSRAIAAETGITPGTSGLAFYTNAKSFVRVEADQEVTVRINGDSGNTLRISPVQAGDPEQVGWFELNGPVWSLVLVNRSTEIVTAEIFTAE